MSHPPTPPRRGLAALVTPRDATTDPPKPSLLKALAKVAEANLAHIVSPEWADQTAEQVMQDYADQGGDPGSHATMFGLAGAGGAIAPDLAVSLAGGAAMKGVQGLAKAGREARFLASLGKEAPDFARAASPLEYLRPAMGEAFTPSLRAQAALSRGARMAGQTATKPSSLAASVLALLSPTAARR